MKLIKEIYDKENLGNAEKDTSEYSDRLSTRGILLNNQGQIAMIHFKHSDLYMLPGGKIDSGEKPEDTIIRETKEETGYTSKIVKELGLIIDFKEKIRQKNFNYCYLLRVEGDKGQRALTKNEIKNGAPDLLWLEPNKALETQKLPVNSTSEEVYIAYFIQEVQRFLLATYIETI